MKNLFLLVSILFSFSVLGAPCNGAAGAIFVNPDGSAGGFVAKTASVLKTASLDSTSSVCERAVVQGFVRIKGSSVISGSAVLEGNSSISNSKVKGNARVLGSSIVAGSIVCQASQINFNVINSTYYCQTEDEEPNDPGELGMRTLIGVDSDVDGVRDDIEIWINMITSNTPSKDYSNIRNALIQLAKELQTGILYKDNPVKASESRRDFLRSFTCLKDVTRKDGNSFDYMGELQINFYNSTPRLKAWAKYQGSLNGQILDSSKTTEKSFCKFKIK